MHVYSDPASRRHVNGLSFVEVPERFPAALAGVEEAQRAGATIERRPGRPVPRDVLAAVHDAAYLSRLEELSAAGGGYLGPDTTLGPHSWAATLLASGAAAGAVDSALSGTAALALVRPPGHHAGRNYGMGFCLLNHAAVAAEYARTRGAGRVAVLDWDVHHGNGTQDIFYADEQVLYLSAHRSPFYPGTGGVREVGEGRGRGFTVNVPLPAGSGEDAYEAAFAGVFLPVLREFRPEIVVVSAGYDAHAADPLGGMRLEAASFGGFAARLSSLAREVGAAPPAFVLEGGYDLRALTACVAATITGAEAGDAEAGDAEAGAGEERPPSQEYSGVVKPVERSREALGPFWECLRRDAASEETPGEPHRRGLLARLRDPRPEDAALPAEADRHLRDNPDDEEVRQARGRLPDLDESE